MNSRDEKLWPNMPDGISEAINLLLSPRRLFHGENHERIALKWHARSDYLAGDVAAGSGWWANDCVRRSRSWRHSLDTVPSEEGTSLSILFSLLDSASKKWK